MLRWYENFIRPPEIPINPIVIVWPKKRGGKANPDPIGLNPEYIIIVVDPIRNPQALFRYNPLKNIVTVISSKLGTGIKTKPSPIASEQKIDALTMLLIDI